jgi:hydroxymethylpyrimidine/phosphomethylpyrimidine kinase
VKAPPVVLTIAGFDPSSGAGVSADLKTIAAHGCYGVACITALTVQSTQGVKRVEAVSPLVLAESLEELAGDMDIRGVHVGMLGDGAVAEVVAEFLSKRRPPNVVLDPIMKSSSGADLLNQQGLEILRTRLLPTVDVITPNVDEAAALTGLKVGNLDQMYPAAEKLHSIGAKAVVITGGHLEKATDLLSTARGGRKVFTAERIPSKSTHGTGCAFATVLACQLALGKRLEEAVPLAKNYVREAISNAYPIGKGSGPLNHFYQFKME